ncbi:MAG: DUF5665 domain-containing protein [Spirochaetia bacterium]|nr:DUF5665 domain-containing protein [Spirochaetia bacterium]
MKKDRKKKKNDPFDLSLDQKLAAMFEAKNIEEFIDIRSRPLRLIFWNFVIGLSRGFGFLLGASVVGVILLAIMKKGLAQLGGMPWIGEKAAEILMNVEEIVRTTGTGQ